MTPQDRLATIIENGPSANVAKSAADFMRMVDLIGGADNITNEAFALKFAIIVGLGSRTTMSLPGILANVLELEPDVNDDFAIRDVILHLTGREEFDVNSPNVNRLGRLYVHMWMKAKVNGIDEVIIINFFENMLLPRIHPLLVIEDGKLVVRDIEA